MLPKIITCPHCNEDLELDEKERTSENIVCPSCSKSIPGDYVKTQQEPPIAEPNKGSKPQERIELLKKDKDWFIIIENGDLQDCHVKEDFIINMRTKILSGEYEKTFTVAIYQKTKEGKWLTTNSTIEKYAKNHFKLRVLYQPVWSHTMEGLKWGAIAGTLLKLLDTFITLMSVDPGMAILFAIAIGVCFIPRIGWMGVAVVSYIMFKFSKANFFFMAIAAALAGALLCCLPGMAIGGIMGLSKKSTLPTAKDAVPEPGGLLYKAVIIPLVLGCTLIILYFFVFNPWLVTVLQ